MEICIGDLRSYNEGDLACKWVKVDFHNKKKLSACIHDFLKEQGEDHEEWFIADYEGFPNLGEYPSIDDIIAVQDVMRNYSDSEIYEVIEDFLQNGYSIDEFADKFRGIFSDEEDYAMHDVESCYDLERIMGNLANYFDYKAYARDLFIGDVYSVKLHSGNIGVYDR